MDTNTDLMRMTQVELYNELKKLNPDFAVGHTRTRRADLEKMVAEARGLIIPPPPQPFVPPTKMDVVPPVKKTAKPKKRKPAPKVVSTSSLLRMSERITTLRMSELERITMLEGLEVVASAGFMLQKSGITMSQISGLIAIDTGIDKEVVRSVLLSLTMLKSTFTPKAAA